MGIPAPSQGKHIHVTHNTRVLQGNILSAWMKGCGRQSSREPLPPACVSLYHLLIIAPAAQQCVGGFNINAFESNQWAYPGMIPGFPRGNEASWARGFWFGTCVRALSQCSPLGRGGGGNFLCSFWRRDAGWDKATSHASASQLIFWGKKGRKKGGKKKDLTVAYLPLQIGSKAKNISFG